MKSLFLDTSAYSSFKRGLPKVLEVISEADVVCLNAVVIGELLSGFDDGKYRGANRKELKEFLNHPTTRILPMTEETSEKYSLIYNHLRRSGTPIPTNDLWIAASVMESGTTLVTGDQHFLKVPQIQTYHLVVPRFL